MGRKVLRRKRRTRPYPHGRPFSARPAYSVDSDQDRLCVLLTNPLVYTDVFPGGDAPGKIFAHSVAHQLLPGWGIAIHLNRLVDGAQQRVAAVFLKLKTSSFLGSCV